MAGLHKVPIVLLSLSLVLMTAGADFPYFGYHDGSPALPIFHGERPHRQAKGNYNCQEIPAKESRTGASEPSPAMRCYRCKDPDNGSSYEQCSTGPRKRKKKPNKDRESVYGEVDYFRPEASEPGGSGPCERVERDDGTLCTVCRDPTGHSDPYERCSYEARPKAYSSYQQRKKTRGEDEDDRGEVGHLHYRHEEPEEAEESQRRCRSVRRRDGRSCRVCIEPRTGTESERCESGPAGSAEEYGAGYSEEEKSESEVRSEQVRGEGECEQVERDGMLCTVCKDPKTGGDYERCSYSYDPADKVYAYSSSKSFGTPGGGGGGDDDEDDAGYYGSVGSSEEEEEQPEESSGAPVIYNADPGAGLRGKVPKKNTQEGRGKPKLDSRVDSGFNDAKVRRAEIERIVRGMDKVDRSKCEKSTRADMSCYRCSDGKGSTNEECVYVTDPGSSYGKRHRDGTPAGSAFLPVTRATTTTTSASSTTGGKLLRILEPLSEGVDGARRARATNKDEAEPYEFVDETRPVYDKVLKITLPAYMVEKSQHEIEFDEAVRAFRR